MLVSSARVVAMALVPLAKAGISNTPMGPFQMTVLQSERAPLSSSMVLGPVNTNINADSSTDTDTKQ